MSPRTLACLALCALACLSMASAARELRDDADADATEPADQQPQQQQVGAYPPVSIFDSTAYIASGKVTYASLLCSDDNYAVTPQTQWQASSRGACLVTQISATVRTPSGDILADPYTSSSTSYSQFAVIQTGPNKFAVTRVVN